MGKPKKQGEQAKDDEILKAKVKPNKHATRHFLYRQKEKAKRQFLEYQAVKLDEEVDELHREISDLGGNIEQFGASAFKRTFLSNESSAKVQVPKVKRDKAEQHKAKIDKDRNRRKFLKDLLSNLREYVKELKAYVKYLTSIRDDLILKANESCHDACETLVKNQSNIAIQPAAVVMQVGDDETLCFYSSNEAVEYWDNCDNGGESGELASPQMPDIDKVQFWADLVDSQMPDMNDTQLFTVLADIDEENIFTELVDTQMIDVDEANLFPELALIQMPYMNGAELLAELADTQMTDIEEAQFCAELADLELPHIDDAQLFAELADSKKPISIEVQFCAGLETPKMLDLDKVLFSVDGLFLN